MKILQTRKENESSYASMESTRDPKMHHRMHLGEPILLLKTTLRELSELEKVMKHKYLLSYVPDPRDIGEGLAYLDPID